MKHGDGSLATLPAELGAHQVRPPLSSKLTSLGLVSPEAIHQPAGPLPLHSDMECLRVHHAWQESRGPLAAKGPS